VAGRHELTFGGVDAHCAPPARPRDAGDVLRRPSLGAQPRRVHDLHLVTDGHGLPLAVALSASQAHESVHATRYEKVAIHYLGLVQISMIRLLVRRHEPPLSHKA